jgi:methylated-DNA-[protein]-cysteine S-methyltransferase
MITLCETIVFESPIGQVRVTESDGFVVAIRLGAIRQEDSRQISLRRGYTRILREAEKQLTEYFSGCRRSFSFPFLFDGTAFQRAVWRALSEIPYGETRSYSEVAAAVGCRKGARAVGQAVGANRLPILIPCHRVIAADGGLGGFGCGLDAKRFLLKLEREHATAATRY